MRPGARRLRRRGPLASALLLLVAACGRGPERDALLPVPLPDLAGLRPELAERITARHRALGELVAERTATDAELAEAYGETGKLLLAAEFADAAEPCFRNAARLEPEEFRWPYLLGHLLRSRGRPEEAEQELRRALRLRPDEPAALVWLGRTLLDRGAADEAERWFARALERSPDSASALYGLGKVALERRDWAAAARHLEAALEQVPDATIVHYPLALAYRGLGDTERAERHLEQRGEVEVFPYDPWMEEVRALIAGPSVLIDRGSRLYVQGRWAEAVEAFRLAVEQDPHDARARVNLGSALLRLGDLEGARREYGQAAALAPDLAAGHYGLGAVAERGGDDGAARPHYEAALAIDPRYPPVRLRLGHVARREGRFAEALEHYRIVLEIDARHPEAQLGRAMALVRLGRWPDARAALEQAVEALPDQPAFSHALARLLLTAPEERVRDAARGMELIQSVARVQQNTDVAETIAMGLAELGRFDEAVTWQRNAIASAEQAGLADVAAAMRSNLERYRQRRPCREPWPAGHALHRPGRDAEPAPLERERPT